MLGKPPAVDKEARETLPDAVPLEGFEQAHRELIADRSIQFQMEPYRPDPPWFDFNPDLSGMAGLLPVLRGLFWVGVALLAAWLLYLIVGRLTGLEIKWGRTARPVAEEPEWRLSEQPARELLSEADALAEAGRFSEAAHLLLFRSIDEIERKRPDTVSKAYTSRDIARLPALPARPAEAFARIVGAVERSLFGGRALGAADWQDCRAAYERFAFAEGWRG